MRSPASSAPTKERRVLGNLDDIKIREFDRRGDGRGELVAVELDDTIPFAVRRFFYIHDVPPGTTRGRHGHFKCRQLLICQHGRLRVDATDGDRTRTLMLMPGQAILIEPGIYISMVHEKPGTIALVLCDQHYDPNDYIRDLDTLRSFRHGG
jgi:dTDP-4-dehydrorhamnose 3,5-epimerase-like enzyme